MKKKNFGVSINLTKTKISMFLAVLFIVGLPFWLGGETQIISGYYPSPYGSYRTFFGDEAKIGDPDNFLLAGTDDIIIGPNTITDRNYFHAQGSPGNLNIVAPAGTSMTFNAASNSIMFMSDLSTNAANRYREYVSNFCYWATPAGAACNAGYVPMARGNAVGTIAYVTTANFEFCCRMSVL
jgi:hypothetical protein